ncbi:MAG: glycosyltransferase [Candidatus Heimdallarchaeota archaeon]|nr:glycosyltransferase [Candidatus Heimdallarchaeota archaeon]
MITEKPIRILQVIHRMRPGGIQAVIMDIYRNIDRDQVQFDFAVRSVQEEHHDREIKSLGGRIFRLPWRSRNPVSPIIYKKAFRSLLQKFGPFAGIHSHVGFYSGLVLPVAKNQGVPVRIAHSHNTSFDPVNPVIIMVWEKLMRLNIQGSGTHLLACNELSADWLYGPEGRDDERVEIIHNSIDLTQFETRTEDQLTLRRSLKLPLKGPLLVHVGRFDNQKNHRYLIEIMAAVVRKIPEAHLLLIGEGELMPMIKQLVREKRIQDHVHFLGVRRDVPLLFRNMDLFVFPSLYEGLPVVMIEAQAAGTPCLVSNTIASEADLNLGLVQYESLEKEPVQWVKKIETMLNPPHVPWSERKRALQREGHDIQSATAQLFNIYTEQHE